MAGLLSEILGFVDRAKQSAGANLGLLFSDPREYAATLNDQAREFNRLQSLATQGDLNARRGLPVTQEQLAARRYVDQVTENVAMGFAGSTKVGKTPFELANETAQANAVKMLGLPPGNTAMDRAKAMGFDQDVYHATTGDIKAFDPLKRGSKSDSGWYGDADYTTPNAQYAHRFVEKPVDGFVSGAVYEQGANILPLKARAKNSYDWRENEPGGIGLLANDRGQSIRKRQDLESQGFDSVAVNNSRIILPEGQSLTAEQWQILTNASPMLKNIGKDKVENLLRKGYDFRDFARSYGIDAAAAMPQQKQLVELATFNPNQLRSRFAAFDPARVNEPDLLAAGIPLGLIAGTEIDIPKPTKKKKAK